MALYFKDIEITNIDNLVPQPGLDITDLWFGSTNVYTVWATYEGTLPATLNTNGDDMRQYQVYGATGGVGEEVDIAGLSEPLCGIGTYTDSLDLSTGILTRRIRKLVLTGNETFTKNRNSETDYLYYVGRGTLLPSSISKTPIVCSHLLEVASAPEGKNDGISTNNNFSVVYVNFGANVMNAQASGNTPDGLKEYLAAQYAAGTPVTIWYVLAAPEVSTITIPSGLTGTIEGYLIQDGTPTPEAPIYPTANGVKQANDTYSIIFHKLDISTSDGTNVTTTPIYIGSDPLGKDEYVDYAEQKVYRMINGALTPTDPPVPFPALPTVDGETVVDYAGSGTAPEKVWLKYRKEGY